VVEVKMTTGRSIYSDLNDKVSEVKREVDNLSREVSSVERNIDNLMNDREETINVMAEFYLPKLTATSIKETIKEKQSIVQQLFKDKQQRKSDLEDAVKTIYEKKSNLLINLKELDNKLDSTKIERDSLKDKYLKILNENTEYNNLLNTARDVSKRVELNTQRVNQVTNESKEKMQVFENNKLFSYLLNKNFGTETYHALSVIKKLDTWVAKIVHYSENKQNYDTLRSTPELMTIELNRRKEELDKIISQGKALEEKYSNETGLTNILANGQALQDKRINLLDEVESYTKQTRQYNQERESLESTKDPYHQKAISELKSYLKGESVAQLKLRAKETPSEKDDGLVIKIEDIDSKIRKYKDSAKQLQEELNTKSKKYNELDDLLDKFRREDYDDSDSRFRSGLDVNSLISAYLLGRLSDNDIWHDLSNHHYIEESYHSSPSYSSSNSSSSSWGSSGGFGGGGGFSSGGGFGGGGGFSSGGGF
jgi:chromosome segregation ATPase